jgi:hypothetical protein
VYLTVGQGPPLPTVTAVINRHGALVLSMLLHDEGTVLRIQNELTSEATDCRVVWVEVDVSGTYKLGIEFIHNTPAFWGEVYEKRMLGTQ